MDTETSSHRRTLGLGVSLVAHVIALGLFAVPPTRVAHSDATLLERSHMQVARRRAPSASDTKPVAPDGGRQADSPPDARKDPAAIRSTVLVIPGFAFDFAKIASRASLLFPFLDLQLSIEAAPEVRLRDGGDGLVFVQTITGHRTDKLPRLRVTPTELQTIVDLAWSRRARWSAFQSIRTITDRYDPNEGRLPTLLRAYVDEDLLQPYQDTTIRDPRLWTQLGIAADHADFVQFITGYAARHPSTRVTTELLFLLDKLAQASLDALTTLLDTEPTRDLRWTVEANRDAYRLIKGIRAFYIDRLGEQAIDRRALKRLYDAVRLMILLSILRTTPQEYRANDARFLIGAIEWRAGDRDAAIRTWQVLQISQADFYATSSSYILGILKERSVGAPLSPEAAARITKVLENEDARWLAFSSARLRRFGYAVDTF